MQRGAFDAAKGAHVDEDVVVDQDEATYEYEGEGSHEGDEDDGEQGEEQGDRLLACLCHTLILIASNNLSLSLYIAHFIFFLHLTKIFSIHFKVFTFSDIELFFQIIKYITNANFCFRGEF